MNQNTQSLEINPEELKGTMDEIIRNSAQKMLKMALELEVQCYTNKMRELTLPDGKAVIVRNGYHDPRDIHLGAGKVEVQVPRTRNRAGTVHNFSSSIVPAYLRRSITIDEAIPLLYLKGLSTNDIQPALEQLFGKGMPGLSSANVSKLKSIWKPEYETWQKRDLSQKHYCYVWVDGVHFQIRIGEERLCVLVAIGATEDGKKELIAVEGGYRESSESWGALLRDLKARGLVDPRLFVGDGALGFWKAARNTYPKAKHQRCWVHKTANILDKLPKSVQPKAKSMIHEIYMAPTEMKANKAYDNFITVFDEKYPKAVGCLTKDKENLFVFYKFPSRHWRHIRSTNIIESTFSTVRLRTKQTRGQGTMSSTLLMVYKLLSAASEHWHYLSGRKLIGKVMSGINFIDGKELQEAA
jgi:putative transposase